MLDTAARHRLKWKCRRGLLELDLVLEKFLNRNAAGLDEAQLATLNELLDLPDNDLWDIVKGGSDAYEPRHGELVERLRAN